MRKVLVDIIEQTAIFDGLPDFSLPLAAVINLLNFHSFGGTPNDMKNAMSDKNIVDPKRYKITLTLEYKELE